jgi:hypothetical protein
LKDDILACVESWDLVMENLDYHYCTTFFGQETLENTWELLDVFWMGIARKCPMAVRHLLDGKSYKMPCGRQAFPLI